jgi:glucokinase
MASEAWFVVGVDNGGTSNNATVLDQQGRFLVDTLMETPSRVEAGPTVAVAAIAEVVEKVLRETGIDRSAVRAVGLDTPGPASADGVISSKGSTNFVHPDWYGYDFRGAVEEMLGIPVIYNNDGNAAALYAHHIHFGEEASNRSSISLIVGTGLGGGVIEAGRVLKGVAGMAGEVGHVHIPMDGLLAEDQPIPSCNCGFVGDAESFASLGAIERNLLPYWLTRFPDHDLARVESLGDAAKLVRGYGEAQDPMAIEIFTQQAMALGRLLTIVSNLFDPSAYFLGGGVVEASPSFREWYLETVRANTSLRKEQLERVTFALIPELDMAGARGAALAAGEWFRSS